MKLKLLTVLLFLSFTSNAQEFKDLPDWTHASFKFEEKKQEKNNEFEQKLKVLLPMLKACGIEWLRSRFCSTCVEYVAKKTLASDSPLLHDVYKILAAKIGFEFFTIAYVLHANGVEINRLSRQALTLMYRNFLHSGTVKALEFIVPDITKIWGLRWCESLTRDQLASYVIKATPGILIECGKQAIAMQKEDEKRAAAIFKNYLPKARWANGNIYELNSGLSPKLIRSIVRQKSTKVK